MPRNKEIDDAQPMPIIQTRATTACYGTISHDPGSPADLYSSSVKLAKLEEENDRLVQVIKDQNEMIDALVGAAMRQKECIKLLVSYLDAPVKARGKLADVERLLK